MLGPRMLIRAEEQEDRARVRAVNVSAFETALEANLVDALREQIGRASCRERVSDTV